MQFHILNNDGHLQGKIQAELSTFALKSRLQEPFLELYYTISFDP